MAAKRKTARQPKLGTHWKKLTGRARELMGIDDDWLVEDGPFSFTWWPSKVAQHIWAEPTTNVDGPDYLRLHARTDLVRGVESSDKTFDFLSLTNMAASLNAVTFDPATGTVAHQCAAHLDYFTSLRVVPLFLAAASMQAIVAQGAAEALSSVIGGEPNYTPHPVSGFRDLGPDLTPVMKELNTAFVTAGEEPSPFTSMDFLKAAYAGREMSVVTTLEETGLTAEFPFLDDKPAPGGETTTVVHFAGEAKHPQLGSGCLILLHLPIQLEEQGLTIPNGMNLLEAGGMETGTQFFGAWCTDSDQSLTFASFLPALVYTPQLTPRTFQDLALRANLARFMLDDLETTKPTRKTSIDPSLSSRGDRGDEAERLPGATGNIGDAAPEWPPSNTETLETVASNQPSRSKAPDGDLDPGMYAVSRVWTIMSIDEEWALSEQRGFTWWGHRLAQRVWADLGVNDLGEDVFVVRAQTDLLTDVDDDASVAGKVAELNADATMNALVWHPERRTISANCTAYVHSQNKEWLSQVFATVVAIQCADAHNRADLLAEMFHGRPHVSQHPQGGQRDEPDGMLNILDSVAGVGWSKQPHFGRQQMEAASKFFLKMGLLSTTGDDALTVEFPFTGDEPAMLRIAKSEPLQTALVEADGAVTHPMFLNGLFIQMRLPRLEHSQAAETACALNQAEALSAFTRSHFFGAWCVRPGDDLAFVMFYPDVLMRSGDGHAPPGISATDYAAQIAVERENLLCNLLMSFAERARWAATFLGDRDTRRQ